MDTAFKAAAFPGYATRELRSMLDDGTLNETSKTFSKVVAEIQRREKAAAGDMSVMTDGERLRFIRTGKPR